MTMKGYSRNSGRVSNSAPRVSAPQSSTDASQNEGRIKVNGYEQVLEMLRIADKDFRESILRRLAVRDPELAASLRATLHAS